MPKRISEDLKCLAIEFFETPAQQYNLADLLNLPNISANHSQTEKIPKYMDPKLITHPSIILGFDCLASVIWQFTFTVIHFWVILVLHSKQ